MVSEQNDVTQLLPDAILIALMREEPPQTLLAHIGFNSRREAPYARDGEGAGIDIGTENLNLRPQLAARGFLQQQNCDAVGFLASCATRYPNPDRLALMLGFKQVGSTLVLSDSKISLSRKKVVTEISKSAKSACTSSGFSRRTS
jgi:hypothetical protein